MCGGTPQSLRNLHFVGEKAKPDFFMCRAGVAPRNFRRGADSCEEGAKIWFSGYYKCQKSPKNFLFILRRGAKLMQNYIYARLFHAVVSQPCYGDIFGIVCRKKWLPPSVPPNTHVDNSEEYTS